MGCFTLQSMGHTNHEYVTGGCHTCRIPSKFSVSLFTGQYLVAALY